MQKQTHKVKIDTIGETGRQTKRQKEIQRESRGIAYVVVASPFL